VEILVSSRSKRRKMMYVSLTLENLEKIIESLKKNHIRKSDNYLIDYLETIKKNNAATQQIDLDEVPF
jgi:uncharacterized protein YcbK (DUF882 family)